VQIIAQLSFVGIPHYYTNSDKMNYYKKTESILINKTCKPISTQHEHLHQEIVSFN